MSEDDLMQTDAKACDNEDEFLGSRYPINRFLTNSIAALCDLERVQEQIAAYKRSLKDAEMVVEAFEKTAYISPDEMKLIAADIAEKEKLIKSNKDDTTEIDLDWFDPFVTSTRLLQNKSEIGNNLLNHLKYILGASPQLYFLQGAETCASDASDDQLKPVG